jgi:hypothetical protein
VRTYEVHAFTNSLPFREFRASEISDSGLYHKVLNERFRLLEAGRPTYFTAVNPDKRRREVYSPHDDRLGTVHIAALDRRSQDIVCVLSLAVDTGDSDGSDIIGLPLENRWKSGGHPNGPSLDRFRERYFSSNGDSSIRIEPWQMVELYRHFRTVSDPGDLTSRIGAYVGAYHLLVREARRKGRQSTHIWVFDAIPRYFHLYRLVGAAVLRDPTIETPPRHISPNVRDMEELVKADKKCVVYKGEVISRSMMVPMPYEEVGELQFVMEEVPFLDGVIDIHKIEYAIQTSPVELSPVRYQGMTDEDITMLRTALSVLGKRHHEHWHHNNPVAISTWNELRQSIAPVWDFTEVGT